MLPGKSYTCKDGSVLSGGQFWLLMALKQHGTISAQDLADKLCLTPGAVSQYVDSLLEGGYITRTPHGDSRRKFDLNLSEAGAKKLLTIQKDKYEFIKRATTSFSDEELETFKNLLQKIISSAQSEQAQNER